MALSKFIITADLEDTEVEELEIGGFSLVFGTWPVVLGTLPGGIHWIRLLFFDLFLLGIDSAFSFLEGFLTVARDTVYFQGTPKWKMTAGLCVVAFLFNLIYATDAGLNWLDVIDFYINFVMLLVSSLICLLCFEHPHVEVVTPRSVYL